MSAEERDASSSSTAKSTTTRSCAANSKLPGHRFETTCDTEVVLRGFLEWDTACFARLRGMFAVALWTESQRRLVLARDRMGIKPLYLRHRGRDLYFGSRAEDHLRAPRDRAAPRPQRAELLPLAQLGSRAPTRWSRASRSCGPANWLEWRDGHIHRELTGHSLRLNPRSDWTLDAAKEELDRLLRESVKEHLISDVPLGVWASGGLDSSTILHYAPQSLPAKAQDFSVSFQRRRLATRAPTSAMSPRPTAPTITSST